MYIIEIENDKPLYVAVWDEGDPPRTLILENAATYYTRKQAEKRIEKVKKSHPLKSFNYKIVEYSII